MKTKFTLTFTAILLAMLVAAQDAEIKISFTGIDNTSPVKLDSIRVINRTHGGDTLLVWPDTVLSFKYVGISEMSGQSDLFNVLPNYPNPVAGSTIISLYVPEKDKVELILTDMLGRVVNRSGIILSKGLHSFRLNPGGSNFYLFTARWRGKGSTIKILQTSNRDDASYSFEYIGCEPSSQPLKATSELMNFPFANGDALLCIGYMNSMESGMLINPEEDGCYFFQFATNIPCPGTPTVDYEGQVYNTIQIFSQCWLKENLNAGWIIPVAGNMSDNGFIEKYCYYDEQDSCAIYGGLYQWDEVMQYTTKQGAQGICPQGWHIPTDEEWKVLEGIVDSQYGMADPEWDLAWHRGLNAGINLKTTYGWDDWGNGTDLFGFSALPGGGRESGGYALNRINGLWWTSTEIDDDYTWYRHIDHDIAGISRYDVDKTYGLSVRCLRDEAFIPSVKLTFTAVNISSYLQLDSITVINRTQGREFTMYWPDTSLLLPDELLFDPGDELLYVGYVDTLESGMVDAPGESELYIFQFASNIPCPGTPIVEYEGQVYKTVQIFGQCWLKENLNVGTLIPGGEDMEDNGIIEKYCYNNEPDSCDKYGGLYQLGEMLQYDTLQGAGGICPPGWHLPSDEEWKVLEGAVDSQYKIGDDQWDGQQIRGVDAGDNLKSISGWNGNGNGTDMFGFSGLPAGEYSAKYSATFMNITNTGCWWATTKLSWPPWDRTLYDTSSGISRPWGNAMGHMYRQEEDGLSVRCIKDY